VHGEEGRKGSHVRVCTAVLRQRLGGGTDVVSQREQKGEQGGERILGVTKVN